MSRLFRHLSKIVASAVAVFATAATPVFTNLESVAAASVTHSSTLLSPGDYSESLTWGGLLRTYIVHVPPGALKIGRPLILVYHGAGDTARNTVKETDFEQAANQANDIVAFLQGYGDTWNELTGHTPAALAHVDDVGFTSAVLNALRPLTGYNIHRVAAAGLSNGALFVETLGCRLASRIDLIVPVEGELASAISPTCAPSRPINVFEIHGTSDPIIPYNGGNFSGVGGTVSVLSAPNSVRRWSRLDRCSAKPQTVHSGDIVSIHYSHCRNSVTVTLRTIIGGIHVWGSNVGQLVTAALGR